MRVVSEENLKNLEIALDEKYAIAKHFESKVDEVAYGAMLKTVEYLGFDWERESTGKHTIFGNYPD